MKEDPKQSNQCTDETSYPATPTEPFERAAEWDVSAAEQAGAGGYFNGSLPPPQQQPAVKHRLLSGWL